MQKESKQYLSKKFFLRNSGSSNSLLLIIALSIMVFPENTAWQLSVDPTKIFLSGYFSFIAEMILVDKKIFSKLESIETKILSSGLDPENNSSILNPLCLSLSFAAVSLKYDSIDCLGVPVFNFSIQCSNPESESETSAMSIKEYKHLSQSVGSSI